MKKILTLALAAAMSLSLVACSNAPSGGDTTTEGTLKDTFNSIYVSDPESMDYLTTAKATSLEILSPLVDGLLTFDNYGHIGGNLAKEWNSSEEGKVWTFKLNEGVKWVTNTGEEYGELKADDFVAGLQHAADFSGEALYLLQGTGAPDSGLVNLNNYLAGTVTDFSEVGVKAVDDYTVEYTFNEPVPYMESMVTYSILYPVNRTFLESQGEGCKLGAPNKEKCSFGSLDPSTILYNGSHLLTALDNKSQVKYTKNESYFKADQVYINEISLVYAGEDQDPYSTITGFENGTYDEASLSPQWEDFEAYKEKYADYYYPTMPNSSIFGINFNYNRQVYDHTANTPEEQANTRQAILNKNFRLAVLSAYDRVKYLEVQVPEDIALAMIRNIDGNPDIVTTSDGKTYGTLVNEAYKELTGVDMDLSDGQDPFLNKDKALEYIEAAKADGVKFPVKLDCAFISNAGDIYKNRAQSMKDSIEANTDGQIIINLIPEDNDTYQALQYLNTDYASCDYDINTFSGWSPDYADPKTYVDVYSTSAGYYMQVIGLPFDAADTPETKAIKEQAGFAEYERLYREADKITDDLDARYAAFAKADAWLVANALMVPGQMNTRGYKVTKVVPFTRQYSTVGLGEYKFVGMKVQNETVTRAQYDAAYEDFQANR